MTTFFKQADICRKNNNSETIKGEVLKCHKGGACSLKQCPMVMNGEVKP